MKTIVLKLPIRISDRNLPNNNKETKRKKREPKKYFLNLNVYRNLNMHVNNNLKIMFKKEVVSLLEEQGINKNLKLEAIEVYYYLFFPDKRGRDIMNVGSITDKFALDAIVEYGIVEDDNYKYIKNQSFRFGGFDEDKEGYALMIIKEVKKKDIFISTTKEIEDLINR